jgi:ribosomal-protein-alanine N-acetyltransferase
LVYWAQQAIKNGNGCPLFLIRKIDRALIGAVTLDNIRRGPAQAGTLGYWTGQAFSRQGYMREAVNCMVSHAFRKLDLSRVEAACLPENQPSRGLLESCGFKYEGVAQSYLQIAGRWRTHVLYAAIRHDRRGKTEAG